jgi:hypothetical protein
MKKGLTTGKPMWWDLNQIGLFDSALFSIVCILILFFVGSGIIRIVSAISKDRLMLSLDFYQKIGFNTFLGFCFVVFFIFIFSILNVPFFISTLLVVMIAVVGFLLKRPSLRLPKSIGVKRVVTICMLIATVVALILLSSALISGFYGSTNDDGADHTLMTRIVLDSPNAVLTHSPEPFGNYFINYPLGSHVFSAFFVTLLGVGIQKIIILISVVVPVLTVLACYATIKSLFGNSTLSILGTIVLAFFTIGVSFVPISWGGVPLLLSMYILVSSMGLVYIFLLKNKLTALGAFFLGLIFFAASQTYPVALLMVTLWFLLVLGTKLLYSIRGSWNLKRLIHTVLKRRNLVILAAFLLPIVFSIPYFSSVLDHKSALIQSNRLDPPMSLPAEIVKARVGFNWLLDIPALSSFFSSFGQLIVLAPISLILLILLFIPPISKKLCSIFSWKDFPRSLALVYVFMLLIMGYLTLSLNFSINYLTSFMNPERVLQHLSIPGAIMTGFVLFFAFSISFFLLKMLLNYKLSPTSGSLLRRIFQKNRNRVMAYVLLALVLFNVGLFSISVIKERQLVYTNAGISIRAYESLHADDLSLMEWIEDNVPLSDHILVSSGDSGQFVSAVTQRQTISISNRLQNYSDLMLIMTSNSSDPKAVPLLAEYNITSVYIGSTGTSYALQNPYYRQFNASQLLLISYFVPLKQIGDAWLFQFNATAAKSLDSLSAI